MSISPEKALKDLMAGLIYPAVLGSIIFQAFDSAEDQLLAALNPKGYAFSSLVALKLLLLCITLFFYGCDYLYLLYTKHFRKLFFFLDVVFVAGLYATIRLVGLDDPASEPKIFWILSIYLLFMLLYFAWDLLEGWQCARGKVASSEEEMQFYRRMIWWEGGSAVLLAAALFCCRWLNPFLSTVLPLSLITGTFAVLAWKKRLYYSLSADSVQKPADVEGHMQTPLPLDENFSRPDGEVVASFTASGPSNPEPQADA